MSGYWQKIEEYMNIDLLFGTTLHYCWIGD